MVVLAYDIRSIVMSCHCGSIRGGPVPLASLALVAETLQDFAQLIGGGTQVVAPGNTTLTFQTIGPSSGTALTPDLPNNRIIVNTAGEYITIHTVRWETGSTAAVQRESYMSPNGAIPSPRSIMPYGLGNWMVEYTNVRAFLAGDLVTLAVTHDDVGNINITTRVLSMFRIL